MPFMAIAAKAVLPSLVSGLFGRSKNRAQGVDYKRLVSDAQNAGINPLTALRNGGTASYTRVPQLSSNAFVGEAMANGLETWFNREQIERDEEREQLENDILKEQLADLREQSKTVRQDANYGYGLTSGYEGSSHGTVAPQLVESRFGRDSGGLRDSRRDGSPTPVVGGLATERNERFSDAQKVEDRYGDVASWAYGLGVVGADAFSSAVREGQAFANRNGLSGQFRGRQGPKLREAESARSRFLWWQYGPRVDGPM